MRFNLGDKLKGAANKIGEKVKSAVRFGMKHKGKIATAGAIVGLGLAGDDQDTIKDKARETATKIMNTLDEEQEGQGVSISQVENPMKQPVGAGNISPVEPKPPGLIQSVKNIPGALKQTEKTAQTIKDASLLQKIPAAQQGAVDIVSAVNKPSRRSLKKARKINEEQRRFIEGEMTDKEAKKFIKKRGKKAKKGKRD